MASVLFIDGRNFTIERPLSKEGADAAIRFFCRAIERAISQYCGR